MGKQMHTRSRNTLACTHRHAYPQAIAARSTPLDQSQPQRQRGLCLQRPPVEYCHAVNHDNAMSTCTQLQRQQQDRHAPSSARYVSVKSQHVTNTNTQQNHDVRVQTYTLYVLQRWAGGEEECRRTAHPSHVDFPAMGQQQLYNRRVSFLAGDKQCRVALRLLSQPFMCEKEHFAIHEQSYNAITTLNSSLNPPTRRKPRG
jgi:hypothetical protein